MASEETRAWFDDYAPALNEQDLPRITAQFADDGVYDDPVVPDPVAGDQIEAYFATTLEGFPDLTFEGQVYEGRACDGLINEWTGTATHTGPYFGLPPTGRSVEIDGVGVLHCSEEGLTRVTNYFDRRTIRRQLGLDFPAVLPQLPRLASRFLRHRL